MSDAITRYPPRAEQRHAPRRRVRLRCRVDDGRVERYTWLVDFGPGGARVLTAAPPPIGRRVELTLALGPRARRIRTPARVVWRTAGWSGRGGLMGIAFAGPVLAIPEGP